MQRQSNGAMENLHNTWEEGQTGAAQEQPKGLLNELLGLKSMGGSTVMARHRKLIFS